MTPEDVRRLFTESGALLSGHFELSSGRHSAEYFQCALVLSDTSAAERLGRALAALVPPDWAPDCVVAPAMGGVLIGHETARALGKRSLFTERKDGEMSLRRGFSVKPGERIVVVEDVITTGKSTGEVVRLLTALGGKVAGALSIVLRTESDPPVGVPVRSLARLPAVSHSPQDCPLCAEGRPAVKPGSRPNPARDIAR